MQIAELGNPVFWKSRVFAGELDVFFHSPLQSGNPVLDFVAEQCRMTHVHIEQQGNMTTGQIMIQTILKQKAETGAEKLLQFSQGLQTFGDVCQIVRKALEIDMPPARYANALSKGKFSRSPDRDSSGLDTIDSADSYCSYIRGWKSS